MNGRYKFHESDRKLFSKKIIDWQESHMERLNKEFAESKARIAAEAKTGRTKAGDVNDFMHSDDADDIKVLEQLFLNQAGKKD